MRMRFGSSFNHDSPRAPIVVPCCRFLPSTHRIRYAVLPAAPTPPVFSGSSEDATTNPIPLHPLSLTATASPTSMSLRPIATPIFISFIKDMVSNQPNLSTAPCQTDMQSSQRSRHARMLLHLGTKITKYFARKGDDGRNRHHENRTAENPGLRRERS